MSATDPLFYSLLARHGIGRPASEHRFDPSRKWRFDYAWPEHKVALEVDGATWAQGRHTRGSGFLKDMEKFNAAACLGWRIVRCVPDDLETTKTAVLILSALNA